MPWFLIGVIAAAFALADEEKSVVSKGKNKPGKPPKKPAKKLADDDSDDDENEGDEE